MIHTQIKYPILLNAYEPGTTIDALAEADVSPWSRDVYRAEYTQGATLDQDHLGSLDLLLGKAGVDEVGLGWTSSLAVCSQVGQGKERVVQVEEAGKPPRQICQASQRVVASFDCSTFWQITNADQRGLIHQWDPVSEQWTEVVSAPGRYLFFAKPHPSEQKLVFSQYRHGFASQLVELDAKSGVSRVRDLPKMDAPMDLAVSPDGKSLAYASDYPSKLRVLDLASGDIRTINRPENEVDFQGGDFWHTNLHWSPDGRRLFYSIETLEPLDDMAMRYGANLLVATPDGQQHRMLLREPYLEERVLSEMRVGREQEQCPRYASGTTSYHGEARWNEATSFGDQPKDGEI